MLLLALNRNIHVYREGNRRVYPGSVYGPLVCKNKAHLNFVRRNDGLYKSIEIIGPPESKKNRADLSGLTGLHGDLTTEEPPLEDRNAEFQKKENIAANTDRDQKSQASHTSNQTGKYSGERNSARRKLFNEEINERGKS